MCSLPGLFQRPLVGAAAAIVAASASFSADVSEKFSSLRSLHWVSESDHKPDSSSGSTWLSHISVSKLTNLSFLTRIPVPFPNLNLPSPGSSFDHVPSLHVLRGIYQSAELAKASRPDARFTHTSTYLDTDVSYRWHLPETNTIDLSKSGNCNFDKNRTVVVLLGWLGSKQKHMKKYAEWYTSRGYHVITFTLPMSEILSYQIGGKAEKNIESLVNHLADWLDEEEDNKYLAFHTFSNTGWLTYGAILEMFLKQDPSLMGRIRGCVIDSAPVDAADPLVFASGFSAAFLKKNSVAIKGSKSSGNDMNMSEAKPAVTEAVLISVLEKLFQVVLNHPKVKRRVSEVVNVLQKEQPKCPQLYMYSTADRVIPAGYVEAFVAEQQKAGHDVRACNFVSTPHVDHFRHNPRLYTTLLSHFFDALVPSSSRHP